MSKKILKATLAAFMAMTMAACGGSGGASGGEAEKVTLTVWTPMEDQRDAGAGEDSEVGGWLKKELDAFEAAHPEWDIEWKIGVASEGDTGTMVPADPEAAADVFLFANDQIPALLDAGALAELGGSTLEAIKANNPEGIVKYVTFNDGVYGVPFTTNTWFMFYDKRVYSEEDVKSLETMLEKGVVAYPLSTAWYFAAFYLANGCEMFGPDGTDNDAGIQFTGDKAVAVTNYLVDLAANKNFKNDQDGVGVGGLSDGSVNAIFSGSWDYQNVVDALGEENVGVAIPPTITIDGEQKQLLSFAGVKAIGVNANSDHMEQAVALAAFLGGTDAQKDHFEMRATVPTDKNVEVSGGAMIEVQNATVDHASFAQPFVPGMSQYWGPAGDFGGNIVQGKVTHDNAKEMTEKANEQYNTAAVN